MARKKNQIELKEYTDQILNKLLPAANIDEVILFGSYANDTADDESDVDIAVISPDFESNNAHLNALNLTNRCKLYDPDLQLLGFKTSTFENPEEWVHPEFIYEIKKTGQKIFQRAN